MDNEAASPLKENINPFLPGRVTKCGVVGRGEAAVLDSVGQILDVLRTGELDTNNEAGQVTNGQTNEPRRERAGSVDSGIFNSIGTSAARDSVDQGAYQNKAFNDSSDSSDISKKQVQPSQQYDSDATSNSSEEDEEDPVGSRVMLPRQDVQMQSNLQNCNNVQVGNKVEISGALTVNTVLNVVSPPGEANAVTPGAPKEPVPAQSLLKQRPPWLVGVGALILVVLAVFIVTMAILIPRKTAEDGMLSRPPIILPAEETVANTLPGGHRILSKRAWGGDPPRAVRPLKHPTPFVVISDTVSQECYTQVECSRRVRIIQAYHLDDLTFNDVGYNFLVGGDGNIYEGRGWNTTSMHTGFVRNCNIGISLVGSFINSAPTKRQINATIGLINRGVEMEMIAEDYKLIGLKQTSAVSSPGVVLYNIIKTWSHFWEPSRDDPGQCSST